MDVFESIDRFPAWQKLTAIGVVIAAILAGFYFWVYKPSLEEIAQLDTQIAALDAKITRGLEMKGKLEQFRREFFLLREKMREAEEVLGDRPAVEILLANIASLANQTGLTVRQFNPQPERQQAFYGEIPVQLDVYGSYHELGRFFEKVANETRIMNVTNISIKTGEGASTVQATCVLTAFWFIGG